MNNGYANAPQYYVYAYIFFLYIIFSPTTKSVGGEGWRSG